MAGTRLNIGRCFQALTLACSTPIKFFLIEEKLGKKLIGPILRSGCVDLDNSEIYLLDGTYLGKLSHLKNNFSRYKNNKKFKLD